MKNVLILGGGFGGVYTAHRLLKNVDPREVRITLVSYNNYFLFVPMLHEVATGNIKIENIIEPIRDVLKGKNFEFRKAVVEKIDLKKKKVKTGDGILDYDYLVVALGSTTNFYGLPGSEHCLTLKSLYDAYRLRNHVIDMFEKASSTKDVRERKNLLSFVIVGGGPTGVELACELSNWIYHNLKKDYSNLDLDEVTISLIDPNDKVFRGMRDKVRDYAMKVLKKKKIDLLMNSKATEVKPSSIAFLSNDKKKVLHSYTIVWTAGVRPVDVPITGVERERGTLPVNEFLQVKGFKEVFSLGDNSSFVNSDGSRNPPTAQLAHQQSKRCADNIADLVKNKGLEPFVYKNKGFLASLGSLNAVADINGFVFHGFPAWWFWRTVYLTKLLGTQNKLRVMFDWTLELFFKRDTSQV